MSKAAVERRIDRTGEHRRAFEKNRRRVLMSQDYCGICGKLVNKSLKRPDPMAPEVDHIVPISKGGHPSDIANLQLTHAACNRMKSNEMQTSQAEPKTDPLAWSRDWYSYRAAAPAK